MVAELYSALSEDMKTRARKKIQSAMEYLMTYGWAILIISVVLVVLFSMGITNPLFFAPKATAGGCQIIRPNGEWTSYDINLLGICNGAIPEYVAQFNGKSSYIGLNNVPQTGRQFTITAWIKENDSSTPREDILGAMGAYLNLQSGKVCQWVINSNGYLCSTQSVSSNQWAFVGETFTPGSSGTETVYLNGQIGNTITKGMGGSSGTSGGDIGVCAYCGPVFWFNGAISNVQFYNTSLSQGNIEALYVEGIGGAPIDLRNLLEWYPLNGNANDYSGNNNDGTASNVIWSGTWWQSYTQP
jgi:hypothetical protein